MYLLPSLLVIFLVYYLESNIVTFLFLTLKHHVLKRLNALLPLSVSLQKLLPRTASNDIQQHVNSANSGNNDNDSQSDCHSDSDSCAPEVMVPDARVRFLMSFEAVLGNTEFEFAVLAFRFLMSFEAVLGNTEVQFNKE
jgi:hypothetical protein